MKRRSGRAPRAAPTPGAEAVATMTIDRIAAGGDGVGRVDGLAVFVPRTAPGDTVQVAYRIQGRLGRGRVLQRLSDGPSRVAPSCPHYDGDRCGGCQLQHLDADAQRDVRRHIVQESLARLARRDIPLPSLTADLQWGYRARLTLTVLPRGGRWVGGLHPHDDARRVFDLEVCPIAHPALVAAWHHVRPHLRRVRMPAGAPLRVSFRLDHDETGAGVAVVVQGGASWPDADAFADAVLGRVGDGEVPRLTAVWWTDDTGHTHRCGGGTGLDAPLNDDASGGEAHAGSVTAFAPSATEALAFAQVNRAVAEALRGRVMDAVRAFRPSQVVDAYAGTGQLTERLAGEGIGVVAIEADRAGVDAALARLGSAPEEVRGRARVVCDLVERALPALTARELPDVVVLNPPRGGVDGRVTAWLEQAPATVRGLVYISCNPATLARDLSRLAGWHIATVECFDMFPQTAHVETVCVLRRSGDGETA